MESIQKYVWTEQSHKIEHSLSSSSIRLLIQLNKINADSVVLNKSLSNMNKYMTAFLIQFDKLLYLSPISFSTS